MAKIPVILLLILALSALGCEAKSNQQNSEILTELKRLASSASKTVSDVTPSKDKVKELTTDEMQKLYSFEYQLVELERELTLQQMQDRLNQLGQETWECAPLETTEKSMRFLCKRKPKTYLRYVPRIF